MRRYRVGAAPRKRSISELRAIARDRVNKPKGSKKGKTMKKLMIAAIAAAALAGCKGLKVKTDTWEVKYLAVLQNNDMQGFKAKAGDAELAIEKTSSSTEPAVAEALHSAAEALDAAAKACSGGACGE